MRRAHFIWEGVTFYLPEQAVKETLRHVASQSAPGSIVVADFMRGSLIEALQRPDLGTQGIFAQAKRAASAGEPWLFGLPDGKERAFFAEAGLEIRPAAEYGRRSDEAIYRTRRDGTLISRPASEVSPNLLVEAAVPDKR